MSEQVCICGHNHVWPPDCGYTPSIMCQTDGCFCRQFRPSLSWPDSGGCYWISGPTQDDDGNRVQAKFLVPCLAQQVLNRIWIVYDGKTYLREDWEEIHGPASFTKTETNPYDSTQ